VVRVGPPAIPKPPSPTLQLVSAPFPHVAFQFSQVPAGLRVIVERRDATNGSWLRIAGPSPAATAVDNSAPPSGAAAYRISYVSADGTVGPPSDVVATPTGK